MVLLSIFCYEHKETRLIFLKYLPGSEASVSVPHGLESRVYRLCGIQDSAYGTHLPVLLCILPGQRPLVLGACPGLHAFCSCIPWFPTVILWLGCPPFSFFPLPPQTLFSWGPSSGFPMHLPYFPSLGIGLLILL